MALLSIQTPSSFILLFSILITVSCFPLTSATRSISSKPVISDVQHALKLAISAMTKVDTDVLKISADSAITEGQVRLIDHDALQMVTCFNEATTSLKNYGNITESDAQALSQSQDDAMNTIYKVVADIYSKKHSFARYTGSIGNDSGSPSYGTRFAQGVLQKIGDSAGAWASECFFRYPAEREYLDQIYFMGRHIRVVISTHIPGMERLDRLSVSPVAM